MRAAALLAVAAVAAACLGARPAAAESILTMSCPANVAYPPPGTDLCKYIMVDTPRPIQPTTYMLADGVYTCNTVLYPYNDPADPTWMTPYGVWMDGNVTNAAGFMTKACIIGGRQTARACVLRPGHRDGSGGLHART